jgi:hypothetical protein
MKLLFHFAYEFLRVHRLLNKHVVLFAFQFVVFGDELFLLLLKICYSLLLILYIILKLFTLLKILLLNCLILHLHKSILLLIQLNNLTLVFLLLICSLVLSYYNLDYIWIKGALKIIVLRFNFLIRIQRKLFWFFYFWRFRLSEYIDFVLWFRIWVGDEVESMCFLGFWKLVFLRTIRVLV